MTTLAPIVFLMDVDNTLLDNDRIVGDVNDYLASLLGNGGRNRYWEHFEALREELGYADYLGALQRLRIEEPTDVRVLQLSGFLMEYPFADRLYPGAMDAIGQLRRWGTTVILSDGDGVFQPRKVQRSGLWDAVEGRVLIYIHKELMLADLEQRFPARHYVMVDDKLRILAAMKKEWEKRLTTIFLRQGHYALGPHPSTHPPADLSLSRIGELIDCDFSAFLTPDAGGLKQETI